MKTQAFLILVFFSLITSCDHRSMRQENNIFDTSASIQTKEYSIAELQKGYREGSFSIESIVRFYLQRIEDIDDDGPTLNAVITTNPNAIKRAKDLDNELANGNYRGAMHGVPILLKDNIDTHDMPTTGGSRALKASYPLSDATIVKKLREAGAVILGKANLSEWANFRGKKSSSGWSGVGGQTKNPYILDRNPCGSSSGSAVAVAANLCVIAIGTETNGSIVCPAQANGVVGIKPTVGLLSRKGIIPISWTQDTAGPIARSIEDAAICLGVLTGLDLADSKTALSKDYAYNNYTKLIRSKNLSRMRIGYFTGADGKNTDVDILSKNAVDAFIKLGAQILEVDQIFLNDELDYNSFQVMLHEYKDGLNDYFLSLGLDSPINNIDELIEFNKSDDLEMTFYKQEYLEMAAAMEGMDSDDYKKHLKAATQGSQINGIDRVMDALDLDAIIAPTGSPAWKTDHSNGDSFTLGTSSPAAISGYPNVTVPMGYVGELPVGLSIFGRQWSEGTLLDIAYVYEQATQHRQEPKYLKE